MNKSYASAAALCLIYNVQAVKITESREPLLTWSPTGHKLGFKHGYFVPNFGPRDVDIGDTYGDLDLAEKQLGHKWNWSKAPGSHDKDYFIPNFGRDADINDSIKNLNEAQSNLGHWDLPKDDWFLQTEEKQETEREPLLTWSPTAHKPGFKMGYTVPNFGADAELADQASFVASTEAQLKHTWTPHYDADDEKWIVPKIDGDFQNPPIAKYLQTDEQVEREPLLTWSPTAKKGGFKKDYFVPNFGPQDVDIGVTYGDLDLAEKQLGHHWNWSKAPGSHDKDYFIPNFGRDSDINDSINHLNQAQDTLGHWDLPKDDWF